MRTRAGCLAVLLAISSLCGCASNPPTAEQLAEQSREAREACLRARGGWREHAPGFGACIWGGR
jgi:hypothetical protein